jgi:putative ABC transport system substrate-binding protein
MISRRTLLGVAAAGALARRAAAQAAPQRIAWLSPTKAADGSVFLDELLAGLRSIGWTGARPLAVEPHWGEDSPERLETLVKDIIASRPRAIVAQGGAALAMHRARTNLPVIFGYSGDPVEAGMVQSLAQPGGNLTGISYLTLELVGKRLELLHELLPGVRRVAAVASPQHPGDKAERHASQVAADALGLSLDYFELRSGQQLPGVLGQVAASKADAAMFFPVQNVITNRRRIAEWSVQHRIPAASGWAQFAEGGNLLSYGPNLRAASRRLAAYVDRVLGGARPADLPVERPSTVELAINLQAARVLGITVPEAMVARADIVIE